MLRHQASLSAKLCNSLRKGITWLVQAGSLLNEAHQGQHAGVGVQLIVLIQQDISGFRHVLQSIQDTLHECPLKIWGTMWSSTQKA